MQFRGAKSFYLFAIFLLILISSQGCINKPKEISPTLLEPKNGAINLPFNNLSFKFKALPGQKYDLIIKDYSSGKEVYTTTATAVNEEVTITIPRGFLEPERKYKWYVRVSGDDSKASSLWNFTTEKNSPPTISSLSPDGTTGHPFGALALTWKASDPNDDELTFTVTVYEEGKDTPVFTQNVSTDACTVKSLKQQMRYTWKVIAKDKWGGTVESPLASFQTKQNEPPENIQLKYPVENSTDVKFNNLMLSWQGFDKDYEDLRYTLYLFKTGTPKGQPLLSNSTVTDYMVTDLVPSTDYTLIIEAIDTYGEKLEKQFTFRTKVNTLPQKPVLIEPKDNYRVNLAKINSLKFKWTTSTDPDEDVVSYRFVISDGNTNRTMYPYNNNEMEFNQLASFFKIGQRYTWYVEALDKHGGSSKSETFSFETYKNNPPTAPTNPYPANNATNLPNRIPRFSWNATDEDGDQLKYDLYIGKSESDLKLVAADLEVNTYSTTMLFDFGTTYYWKVIVKDGYNDPVEGPIWKFTITNEDRPPTNPLLISPANTQTNINFNNIQLRWKASSDNETPKENLVYYVYCGRADEMTLFATVPGQLTDELTYTLSGLKPVTTYYWRVEVKDSFGNYAYSDTWSFTTKQNTAPNWPSNPNPEDGGSITGTGNLTLSWNASDPDGDNLTYEVRVSTSTSLLQSVEPIISSNNNVTITINEKGTYYWYVTLKDPHGGVTEGPVWRFEVK